MNKIVKIIFQDTLRSKIVLVYFLMLSVLSWVSLALENNESKGILTSMNILLFIVPLVTLLYTTIYIYNSKEFIVLLLSQPIRRGKIWNNLYAGVAGSLLLAFLLGAGIPLLVYTGAVGFLIILMGMVTTLIFVSMAFLTAMLTNDKARGIGMVILFWLFFTILYDGICLFILFQFSDYPIEGPMMALLMLNPIDLARFQVILRLDVSAMMGYSGAVFKAFLGKESGSLVSGVILVAWIIVPYLLSLHKFRHKDM